MKRIQIKKNGIVTNQVELPVTEADAWLQEHLAQNTFGKPAVYESVLNESTGDYEQVLVTPAEEFEVVETDITEEYNKQQSFQEKIAQGAVNKAACDRVLNYINGYNDGRLDSTQILQMAQTFATAEMLLNRKMPKTAKQVIEQINPDGTIVTQELKDNILWILKDF